MHKPCLLFVLSALAAFAADLTGAWKVKTTTYHEVQVPPGPVIVVDGLVVGSGRPVSPADTLPRPMGTRTVKVTVVHTFVFKAKGDQLTGTREYGGKNSKKGLRGKLPIVNGKINGNEISFGVNEKSGNYKEYEGTVSGKEIRFRVTLHQNDGTLLQRNEIAKK